MKILILDNDHQIRALLRRILAREGFECETTGHPRDALAMLRGPRATGFDLITLDVMMPGMWGWEFLTRLRGGGDDTPVLVLSGRGVVEERVRLLELGADDFLAKPFSVDELLARVHAILRRTWSVPVLALGELRMHLLERRVDLAGEPADFSPKEFALLRVLLAARGQPVSRSDLLGNVWGLHFHTGTNLVEVHIARLRRKLRGIESVRIETLTGKGYRLVACPVPSSSPG